MIFHSNNDLSQILFTQQHSNRPIGRSIHAVLVREGIKCEVWESCDVELKVEIMIVEFVMVFCPLFIESFSFTVSAFLQTFYVHVCVGWFG